MPDTERPTRDDVVEGQNIRFFIIAFSGRACCEDLPFFDIMHLECLI